MKKLCLVPLLFVLVVLLMCPGVAFGAAPTPVPLRASDLKSVGTGGLGDGQNSYAWSMAEFNGDIYIGTGRLCDTFNPMWETIWKYLTPGERPPEIPDVAHPPFMQDFLAVGPAGPYVRDVAAWNAFNAVSRAEIWRYHEGSWTRVYQAGFLPSVLAAVDGTRPYLASAATGFRSMVAYRDKSGQNALYASSGGINFAYNPPKLFRTLNGVTWTPLATPPGMGTESRALAVHNGKLYSGVGSAGTGNVASVWCNDDPSTTASWKKVLDFPTLDPGNSGVVSIASFNGLVYVGTENTQGFQVWRSKVADPTGNGDWVKVMSDGGGDRYNMWAATMKSFKGQLYVGSISLPYLSGYNGFKGFELFRISTLDRWQLLVGDRTPAIPVPGTGTRRALSGLPAGFGNPLNFYCWSLEEYRGYLYLGTFDPSVLIRYLPLYEGPLPAALAGLPQSVIDLSQLTAGADLWRSSTGSLWLPVSLNGMGDPENYGTRTMTATSSALWLGTANPFEGFEVWRSRR